MSSEWKKVTVEDIASSQPAALSTGPFGSSIGAKHFTHSGVPVIRGSNLSSEISTRLSDEGLVFVSLEKSKEFQRSIARKEDLVFTCWGTINQVGYIDDSAKFLEYIVSNKQMKLTLDKSRAHPLYIYYVFSGPEKQREILDNGIGSSVPGFNLGQLKKHQIFLPPLAEQKYIAALLGNLDDRITLLRETNTTLEAIAQALFKSWFVDFAPVHAKQQGRAPEGMDAQTAALFPDSFEESELVMVPKGWSVSSLGNFCSVTIGGLWGKDEQEEQELMPAISLRGVDLENLRLNGFAFNAPVRWAKESALEKRKLSSSQVLIASSGAGPCGRALWAGAPFEDLYKKPVIFSNFVKRFECGSEIRALYVDRVLAEMRDSKEIWNFINGTSIPNLDEKLLLNTKKIVMPSDEVLLAFSKVLKIVYAKLYDDKEQTLAELRDILLPRLISGQLRLPEAQALVAEATAS